MVAMNRCAAPASGGYAWRMSGYLLEALGEDAVLLRFGDGIDAASNRAVHVFAARCMALAPRWLRDCVPAYASLALFVDRGGLDDPAADPLEAVREWLSRHIASNREAADRVARPAIEVPVCYDRAFAPDLDALAEHAGLSPEAVIERHQAAVYTVAMIGFAPGFPYLLGLDPILAMPRLATPRTQVPAGSVAVGGAQAGIYPRESPGGWRIIGRTPVCLFDPVRAAPSVLSPGQTVRFVAIDRASFEKRVRA